MTNTPAIPELPEPELGHIKTDKSNQPAFSARQMRAAMQAQPAELSDAEIDEVWRQHNVTNEAFGEVMDAQAFEHAARAILALRQQSESEPFGYFRATPDGWEDCSERDEGAKALYERPQASPKAALMAEHRDYIDGYRAGIEDGQRLGQQSVPMTGKQASLLSREELAGCCGGCASNSAIETWMRRVIEKFCEVNGITAPAGGEKQA